MRSLGGMWQSTKQSVVFKSVPLPFTAAEAAERGISAYALTEHDRFIQIFRGIWVDTESLTDAPTPQWADHEWLKTWMYMTGIRRLHPALAADHLTAARLYGLPLPSQIKDRNIYVATPTRGQRIKRPGLVVSRPTRLATEWIDLLRLPLVTIPRLVASLTPLLSLNELVALCDAATGRQASGPYITIERLLSDIDNLPRVPQRRKARKALALVRPTVESPQETWLRLWLTDHDFPEPVVHPAVCSGIDGCVLHPDLGYPELRIAIEYEGDHHRSSPGQYAQDIRRRELLEAEGWVLLRVAKRSDMDSFARRLRHLMAERKLSH